MHELSAFDVKELRTLVLGPAARVLLHSRFFGKCFRCSRLLVFQQGSREFWFVRNGFVFRQACLVLWLLDNGFVLRLAFPAFELNGSSFDFFFFWQAKFFSGFFLSIAKSHGVRRAC